MINPGCVLFYQKTGSLKLVVGKTLFTPADFAPESTSYCELGNSTAFKVSLRTYTIHPLIIVWSR